MFNPVFNSSLFGRRLVYNNEKPGGASEGGPSMPRESGDIGSEVKEKAKVAIDNAEAKIATLANRKDDPKVAEEVKDLKETVSALQAFIDHFDAEKADAKATVFKMVIELLQRSGNNDLITSIQNINNKLLVQKELVKMRQENGNSLLILNSNTALVWNGSKKKMIVVTYSMEDRNGVKVPCVDFQSSYENNSLDGINVDNVTFLSSDKLGSFSSLAEETVKNNDEMETLSEKYKEAKSRVMDVFNRFSHTSALGAALDNGVIDSKYIGNKLAEWLHRVDLSFLANNGLTVIMPELKGREKGADGFFNVTYVTELHFYEGKPFVEVSRVVDDPKQTAENQGVQVAVNTEDKTDKTKAEKPKTA